MGPERTGTARRTLAIAASALMGVVPFLVTSPAAAAPPPSAPSAADLPSGCSQDAPPGSDVTCTFESTGTEQTFTVPSGVHSVDLHVVGAAGGQAQRNGGPGGTATIDDYSAHPGDVLYVEVGGKGGAGQRSAGGAGGFNGGGSGGGNAALGGAGGGGASDVRTVSRSDTTGTESLDSRILVAAGGGGGCGYHPGGGPGESGGSGGGGGATLTAGGAAAGGGATGGRLGVGGNGAPAGGCGGGGGYYGGGGGGSAGPGSGGGGSNYAPGGTTGTASNAAGSHSEVTISYQPTGTATGIRLSPASGTIAPGSSATYLVATLNAEGWTLTDVTGESTLTITPDGSCDGATCIPDAIGPHTVTAHFESFTATAALDVAPSTTYATPTPADNANCLSTATACALETALTTAAPGGTVVLAGGTYPDVSTTVSKSVELTAQDGGTPVLESATSIPNSDDDVPMLVIDAGTTVKLNGLTFFVHRSHTGVQSFGALTVQGSTFTGNTGQGTEGVHSEPHSTLRVDASTFTKLETGIFTWVKNTQEPTTVTNSTFSANGDSAIDNSGTTLVVHNSTIVGNGATQDGNGGHGGIYTYSGTVKLRGDLLADNTGGDCDIEQQVSVVGTVVDGSGNIDSDGTCGFTDTNSISHSATITGSLGDLAANGGPTKTIALDATSPAIGLVPHPACPPVDQRNLPRPSTGPCDAGAWQHQVAGRTAQTITFTSTPPTPSVIGGTYTPSASASSGLSVQFSIDAASGNGVCSIDDAGVVSFDAAGTCIIDADQPGDDTYDPAPEVSQSFKVVPPAALNDAEQFVQRAYNAILGRDADTGGLAYWAARLVGGEQPAEVTAQLAASSEAQRHLVGLAYAEALGRSPDPGGAAFWGGAISSSPDSSGAVLAALFGSHEGLTHAGGTAADLVAELYHEVLGRGPDHSGSTFWTAAIGPHGGSTASRTAVAAAVIASHEAAHHAVVSAVDRVCGAETQLPGDLGSRLVSRYRTGGENPLALAGRVLAVVCPAPLTPSP